MINVQGTFNDGRGASGLNAVTPMKYILTSRLGTGTPQGNRPRRLTGKPAPPADSPDRIVPGPRPSKATQIRHRQQFVKWIQRWAPQLYARAKKSADVAQAREGALNGLGGWWESFTDSLTKVGGAVLQYKTQKEILDAQLERMRQGLPPLQISEYAPTIRIQPDAGTTREITGAIGAGFGKMLPWIALGGGGLLLLTMMKPRRRR